MTPTKPFDTYKWRWLSVAPTESLLDPPIFLGVLRVLSRHEGEAPSAAQIATELGVVQRETNSPVNLVRTPERNLIRNSGQYWKGTGLLATQDGEIHLTNFGRRVANGDITQGEFAATMVQQTVLPNPWTYAAAEIAKWEAAQLTIRPLVLILEVLKELGARHGGTGNAYITTDELIRILIPLAGAIVGGADIADHIIQFRTGSLDISQWPDCAPQANDKRLAREFLLFLSNYGICRRVENGRGNTDERFYLEELFDISALATTTTSSIFDNDDATEAAVEEARHSPIPSLIERRRMVVSALARPGQAQFRQGILTAYSGACFLTGEKITEILEAAHIVPVKNGGSDAVDNGICLRTDIHRLFDSGKIRLRPSGEMAFADEVKASKNYSTLPPKFTIPDFVNPANIKWRDEYL